LTSFIRIQKPVELKENDSDDVKNDDERNPSEDPSEATVQLSIEAQPSRKIDENDEVNAFQNRRLRNARKTKHDDRKVFSELSKPFVLLQSCRSAWSLLVAAGLLFRSRTCH
jgi:hypothetical protein